MNRHALAALSVLSIGAPALAQGGGVTLNLAAGLQAEAAQQPESSQPPAEAAPAVPEESASIEAAGPSFGHAGASLWGVGAGYMNDFEDNHAGEFHVSYSHFVADELEFNLELSGWYFSQEGDDAGGISPMMSLRWHFLHDEAYDWSVFGEAGFGVLFAFDNVPEGGTGFNFLPRLGAGFTKRLDEDGTRLMMGVRWQHLSNGRIEGDERNPSRDSIMVFAGVMFEF
jgi:hypothetical protein